MAIEVWGHTFAVRRGRLRLWERVLYDGRQVSRRRFGGGGTHRFSVVEAGRPERYEIDTAPDQLGRIKAIRRSSATVYRGDAG
jgi:hypothetical protein